jgi:hypothetical protein
VRVARDRASTLVPIAVIAAATLVAGSTFPSAEELLVASPSRSCSPARLRVPDRRSGLVRRVSTATFGVYLLHPLIGKVVGALFDVFAWPAWVHASAVWTLAVLGVLALRALGLRWHELSTARPRGVAALPAESASERRAA